ncbi:MAG TPA: 3-hydroxyacyl-CoA dehydrogenase NAD-binding domain-containing protein [Acetobacteraceae bacterium]|nr:3-hydroxyacyl-CoA dehydrogenase NAD-binding domain-containing protein [Acetobacteraceae bacterium]
MSGTDEKVALTRHGNVAVIEMKNPPVNALSFALRDGIARALAAVRDDAALRAVVLTGSARAFSAGADISEFGKPSRSPNLREVIATIEDFPKPVVAAISCLALGGGLELAMACHARIATRETRVGLPEVKLGLLPGAGGTQRLPRLAGVARALEIIVTGDMVPAERALADGIIDALIDGALPDAAIAYARAAAPGGRVRDRDEKLAEARADPALFDRVAAPLVKRARDPSAARACVAAVRAAATLPFAEGEAEERRLFVERHDSPESQAQRYAFFAEREAQKVAGLGPEVQPRPVRRAVVVGAGTMGGGIAMCFAEAGIPVTMIETGAEALERGRARIAGNYETSVKRGSLSAGESARRLALIEGALDFAPVEAADIVIEAAFEEMDVKKQVFAELDRRAPAGAVLATNTSYLNVNEIAATTRRPADVLGMHFFSPANVMKLLEVVRGEKTAPDALATAMAVGRKIGKVPVVVGVCHGFVGNRMLARRSVQTERLLLEGALPQDVDRALTEFGFRMGPCAMGDLAGLDVGWRIRRAMNMRAPVSDALCEAGRFGQKTGRGYYLYEGREARPDPEVTALIERVSAAEGLARRDIGQTEILERLIYPMIDEGARILEERIAERPGDIDVIWIYGYNWPVWRGGPMWYGDHVGLAHVRDRLIAYARQTGDEKLQPSSLLARLAAEGRGFASLGRAATQS